MAITVRQNSTSPGIGNGHLIQSVTSNSGSRPQFRFVTDINDKDGELLQRVKQQANPNGTGIFDLGNIIPNYLGPTDTVWDISAVTANTACGKDFQIRFGEEYAYSSTGSTAIYTGESPDAAGDPNVSGSNYIFLLDGVLNSAAMTNFNWSSGSKYDEEDTDGSSTFSYQNGLTRFNTASVRLGDYHTLSFLNGNVAGVTGSAVNNSEAQDIYAMTIRQYNSAGTLLDTDYIYNNAGPRSDQSELWDDVYQAQNENTRLVHFPAGPENLVDSGLTLQTGLAYYTLTFNNQTIEPGINTNGVYGEYRFDITDANCGYDGVRFAWKNEYGVWDYFNFALESSTTSNVEREQFEQNFVDFSATNTVTYDRERRGFEQFQNRVNKQRTANTGYLTQDNADNLRELFYSTNVYVQRSNGEWWPVVIESASVTEKTNPRSQKLFTYTVNWRYANDQRARR